MLEILGLTYNDLPPVVPVAGTISGSGATIGRGRDNAIVLPDPKRIVSRQHLKFILVEGNKYLIHNVSSGNSVFINETELAPGMECPLKDHDKILIGGYVLQVNYVVQAQKGAPQAQPISAEQAQPMSTDVVCDDFLAELLGSAAVGVKPETSEPEAEGQGGIPDPFMYGASSEKNDVMQMLNEQGVDPGSLDGKGDDLINGKDAGMTMDELLRDPLSVSTNQSQKYGNALDPMAMFGEAGDVGVLGDILQPGSTASSVPPGVGLTHSSELNALFNLPSASENPSPRPSVPAVEPQSPNLDSHSADNAGNVSDFDDIDSLIAGLGCDPAPVPGATQPVDDPALLPDVALADIGLPPPPVAADVPVPPHAPPAHVSNTPPGMSNTPSSAMPGTEELYQAFIEGLGMELPGREVLDKAFMNMLGQVLRSYTQGTVELIAGRTVVKQAVRANLTVIAPERNNPLKFSPDGNTAVLGMFGRVLPGFMGPVEAVRNAYVDLRAHQIGVVSGMQAALNHVLDRFSPAMLNDKIPPRGVLENMFSVQHKARLWSEYEHYFYALREKANDHFQEFFGKAFLEAYERAILTVQSGEGTDRS